MIAHSALQLALAAAFLLCPQTPELPVKDWIQRSAELEDLTLEFELQSAEGDVRLIRFTYEAPRRAFLDFGEGGSMWIDEGRTTVQSSERLTTFDFEETESASRAWLVEFCRQFPREAACQHPDASLQFSIWPDPEQDTVLIGASYGCSSGDLFAWLRLLLADEFDVTAVQDGFEVTKGEELSLQLEPRLGALRSIWMGTGDDRRQALKLVSMAVDEGVEIPAAPEGAEDIGEQVAAGFWGLYRNLAYKWLIARSTEEGIELEARERELVVRSFGAYYEGFQMPLLERWSARLQQNAEDWLVDVREFYEHLPEEQKTPEGLRRMKRELEDHRREYLDVKVAEVIDSMSPPSVEDVSEEELEEVLELEREGTRACFEEHLVEPHMEFIREELETLGHTASETFLPATSDRRSEAQDYGSPVALPRNAVETP